MDFIITSINTKQIVNERELWEQEQERDTEQDTERDTGYDTDTETYAEDYHDDMEGCDDEWYSLHVV
jgi:hypothetical protein